MKLPKKYLKKAKNVMAKIVNFSGEKVDIN